MFIRNLIGRINLLHIPGATLMSRAGKRGVFIEFEKAGLWNGKEAALLDIYVLFKRGLRESDGIIIKKEPFWKRRLEKKGVVIGTVNYQKPVYNEKKFEDFEDPTPEKYADNPESPI